MRPQEAALAGEASAARHQYPGVVDMVVDTEGDMEVMEDMEDMEEVIEEEGLDFLLFLHLQSQRLEE